MNALLKKGGALILFCNNPKNRWPNLQKQLDEQEDIGQLYPAGFHPQGGSAWWPWEGRLIWLSKILDVAAALFFGRYETGLRFGRCWIIRGIKRDEITLLS